MKLKILCVVSFILSVLFFVKANLAETYKGEPPTAYPDGWYYIRENEEVPISLPADIRLQDEAFVIIYNDSIASESTGENIFIKNAIYRPEIYLGDTLLYRYTDGGLRRNPPELSYQRCIGKIKDGVKTGTVKMVYHRSNHDVISLPMVYIGSTDSIVRDLFFSNAYISVITITMIMLGIFVLLIAVFTRKETYEYKQKLCTLGCFLLILGIWSLSDSPLLQYLLGYSNINMYIDFFIFMLLILPFAEYVKQLSGMEKYKSLSCIILLGFINIIIQTLLALFNVFTYIEMVPVTHTLIVVGLLSSLFLLFKEYAANRNRDIFLCLRAFAIAGSFSVFAIFLYIFKPELFYQNLLQTGLLLFLLMLLTNVVSEFIKSLKYKAEASNYKQLAEVDKLTNLKNRRGFDLKISEIEKNIEKYDNILLMFIDMNGLKRINDVYGHTKGDETIIAAANCIRRAYKNHGFCYRIGGDEFCTVIENPLFSEQDAISFLEHEVENYNKELCDDCHFSMAVGSSLLREGDGTIKDIAGWKKEADYKMYEDKKEKKFKERNK